MALFNQLVSDNNTKGKVVGIEHIPQLVDWSVTNLKRDGLGEALENGEIIMVAGDGRKGEYLSPSFLAREVIVCEIRIC